MTALEFLQSPEGSRLLARAAESAGTPLSVHYVKRNQEGMRVCGWGQCAACRAVSEMAGGTAACRLSRTTASAMALRQRRPIAYVCHMGFACVALAPFDGEGYVITLGPYCPMEEQRSLEEDVHAGLEALGAEPDEGTAVALEDIHRAPASAVPAVAAWLRESIAGAWAAARPPEEDLAADAEESEQGPARSRAPSGESFPDRHGALARDLAAALAGGNHAHARALIQGQLEELGRGAGRHEGVRRARVASLTAAAMEALGRAGVPLEAAWARHADFAARLPELRGDSALLDGALGVFAYLRRKEVREAQAVRLPHYPELHAVVTARLLDGVTLEYVAGELGQTPSAITHRLQRKFGMSFSEYVGRLRVDMAKQLFRKTRLSVTEVAHRTGIADQSNFAKLFKKFEGVTPAAYRETHGKGR